MLDNIEGEDVQSCDQFLSILVRETNRLAQLISDLLDLSRLEAGRLGAQELDRHRRAAFECLGHA